MGGESESEEVMGYFERSKRMLWFGETVVYRKAINYLISSEEV